MLTALTITCARCGRTEGFPGGVSTSRRGKWKVGWDDDALRVCADGCAEALHLQQTATDLIVIWLALLVAWSCICSSSLLAHVSVLIFLTVYPRYVVSIAQKSGVGIQRTVPVFQGGQVLTNPRMQRSRQQRLQLPRISGVSCSFLHPIDLIGEHAGSVFFSFLSGQKYSIPRKSAGIFLRVVQRPRLCGRRLAAARPLTSHGDVRGGSSETVVDMKVSVIETCAQT
jgi:hypothetical protein